MEPVEAKDLRSPAEGSRERPKEANHTSRAAGAFARTASPHFAVSTKWSFSTTVYSFAAGSAILYIVPSSCFP